MMKKAKDTSPGPIYYIPWSLFLTYNNTFNQNSAYSNFYTVDSVIVLTDDS